MALFSIRSFLSFDTIFIVTKCKDFAKNGTFSSNTLVKQNYGEYFSDFFLFSEISEKLDNVLIVSKNNVGRKFICEPLVIHK